MFVARIKCFTYNVSKGSPKLCGDVDLNKHAPFTDLIIPSISIISFERRTGDDDKGPM